MVVPTSSLTYSVVIPAFNAENTIERAVASVLAQAEKPLEIVVVDDGSKTPLESAWAHIPNRVQLVRQANQGAAAARNAGIDLARGDLVAFLDADDYWLPDKMTRQIHTFLAFPELSISGGAFYEQECHGEKRLRRLAASVEWSTRPQSLKGPDVFDAACALWTGTVVVRRSHLGDRRFRTGWEPAEDRELWLRLVRHAQVMFHREPLAVAVLEPNSLSRSAIDRDCCNMLRVINEGRKELGWRRSRDWRLRTYRRWASEYLGLGNIAAFRPAWKRWCREPWSAEASWICLRCLGLMFGEKKPSRGVR